MVDDKEAKKKTHNIALVVACAVTMVVILAISARQHSNNKHLYASGKSGILLCSYDKHGVLISAFRNLQMKVTNASGKEELISVDFNTDTGLKDAANMLSASTVFTVANEDCPSHILIKEW